MSYLHSPPPSLPPPLLCTVPERPSPSPSSPFENGNGGIRRGIRSFRNWKSGIRADDWRIRREKGKCHTNVGKEQEEERQLAALRKTPPPPLSCRRFVVVVVFVVPVPLVSLSLSLSRFSAF